MSKKIEFISYVNENLFNLIDMDIVPPNVIDYWTALIEGSTKEKSKFTDNGKLVMKYLKTLPEGTPAMKAKDIAEAMGISGRSVSGAMRKLAEDAYVEKVGKDPILYCLTESGKTVEID